MRIFQSAYLFLAFGFAGLSQSGEIFDLEFIRDPGNLEVQVLQDWHAVEGRIPTRQKLVTINVGEPWPGQDYRIPVRMVVPADQKAKGFHLTGGNTPKKLEQDTRPNATGLELLKGGVGLVQTVVQEPSTYGEPELGGESNSRFARSLNPRHNIKYWAWPATLMRAITTAYAEDGHFETGKIAVTGSSKNGASPSMAILHDDRMTAVHAMVSPIWDSPLRLCDDETWKQHLKEGGRYRGFLGGHFGPGYFQAAMDAGHSWEELKMFTRDISGDVFISRNLDALRGRGVEMLFHPGTHDFVCYDLAWGGAHHPTIPVYLGANTGHGGKGHPDNPRDLQNSAVFLFQHFFPDEVSAPLLTPPTVTTGVEAGFLKISVRFPLGSAEESGRIWWIYNRAPDGSPRYIKELIPEEQTSEMTPDKKGGSWNARIELDANASHIDFFSSHRKTVDFRGNTYPTYLSCPYTRVQLR